MEEGGVEIYIHESLHETTPFITSATSIEHVAIGIKKEIIHVYVL